MAFYNSYSYSPSPALSVPHMPAGEPYSIPYHHLPHNHRSNVPRQLQPPSPDALPKPPTASKGKGAPKGKGAVRAKSGCYTCRIRRKKCDEQPDASGSCQTCIRLRLECLGFGAKRPDWMRENNSVPELREKIKLFLASQGMIKGHSGAGARNSADGNGPILMLSTDASQASRNSASSTGSSPSSPQSPPSAVTNSSHHYPHVVTSSLRDMRDPPRGADAYHSPLSPDDSYYSSSPAAHGPLPSIQQSSTLHTHGILHPVNADIPYNMPSYMQNQHHSESGGNGNSVSPTLHHHNPMTPMTPVHSSHSYFDRPPILAPIQTPYSKTRNASPPSASTTSSMPFSPRSEIRSEDLYRSPVSPRIVPKEEPGSNENKLQVALTPFHSQLSPIYNANFDSELDDHDLATSPTHYRIPRSIPLADPMEVQYIGYYMTEVFAKQYLLAERSVGELLYAFALTSQTAKDAMCLLSSLHLHCMRILGIPRQEPPDMRDVNFFYRKVKDGLDTDNIDIRTYSEGDAMAGLHMVSSFLFSGGRGPWPVFLAVSLSWVQAFFNRFRSPSEALLQASKSERFIVRATMWFDVWGSITRLNQPRLLHIYRELFGNEPKAHIGAPNEREMGSVVGCTNMCFRAMAEIATLAYWKHEHLEKGSLSMPQLCKRGEQIESNWLSPHVSQRPTDPRPVDDVELRRNVVADVFTASAKVYLHMVLSRSFPACPEIKQGVAETIEHLNRIPPMDHINTRAVLRSVIFPICICGCLTDEEEHKRFFLDRLEGLGEEARVFGNVGAVKELMTKVWAMRAQTGKDIDWREVMFMEAEETLLLV